MNFAPLVRIVLRYVAGAGFMGSIAIGERLAADPDVVALCSLSLGFLVEAYYAWSKKTGGAT